MKRAISRKACSLFAIILGFSATGANAQSWTSTPDAPRGMTAAVAQWPSGISMIARCADERGLDLMLTLAQPIAQDHVAVTIVMDSEEPEEQRWRVSDNGDLLFVRQPARLSRGLVNGMPLTFLVVPDEGPRHRYELESPANIDALASVVTACDHPLTSPIGEESVITNPDWSRRPEGASLARWYPRVAAERRIDGEAVIECRVAPNGRVEDCIIISESPEDMEFGAAAVALSEEFRMFPMRSDGTSVGEALVRIPLNWRMEDSPSGRIEP